MSAAPTSLRDLVATHIDSALTQFQKDHPHLAAALDRIALIETTISRLEDDPDYRAAMQQSGIDELTLGLTNRVVDLVKRYAAKAVCL